ncbi:MAG: nitrogenase stabilizing/protective protein NifW [Pseudomonadota bacterium]
MSKSYEENGVLDHIAALSSAEDIFTYLLLPFDQSVLNVSRLHIMKRMGQYLSEANVDASDSDEAFLKARTALKQAYTDFVESTPGTEKVFKVFEDEAEKYARRFVGLDSLTVAAEEA